MNVPEIREALLLAQELDTIVDHQDARYPNIGVVSQEAAAELRRQHARIQELEEFASAISQYGVLIHAGLRHQRESLKDLSAALAQCVELAQGVLK